MKSSPFKTSFFQLSFTPAKQIVGCEINGWMETQQKNIKQHSKPQIRKYPKIVKNNTQVTSIAQLRQRRASLLKNTLKMYTGKQMPLTATSSDNATDQKTEQGSTNDRKQLSIPQSSLELKLIQVSQFCPFVDHKVALIGKNFRASIKPNSVRINGEGKQEILNRLKLKTGRVLSSSKRAIKYPTASLEIVQNKVTQNQYKAHHLAIRNKAIFL